jgi:hypothetical protein
LDINTFNKDRKLSPEKSQREAELRFEQEHNMKSIDDMKKNLEKI